MQLKPSLDTFGVNLLLQAFTTIALRLCSLHPVKSDSSKGEKCREN